MKTISWTVIHWKALARKIWFPTANLHLENWIVEDGTYKINIIIPPSQRGARGGWTSFKGEDMRVRLWAGAYREKEELFEAHLFGFDWDLYWKTLEIIILEKIRENIKINNLEELKVLIQKDIEYIRKNTFYGITFWTFDKFHPWHKYYLQEAKKYCEKLITVVSTDLNVQQIKKHTPVNIQEQRKISVQKSKIPDLVFIWEERNHLKYFKKYSPKIICLWYDQEWFIEELQIYIKKNNLRTEIIRIWDYKSDIYKSSKI